MQLLPLVNPSEVLSKDEISRYSRHLLIPDFGLEGLFGLSNRHGKSSLFVRFARGVASPDVVLPERRGRASRMTK